MLIFIKCLYLHPKTPKVQKESHKSEVRPEHDHVGRPTRDRVKSRSHVVQRATVLEAEDSVSEFETDFLQAPLWESQRDSSDELQMSSRRVYRASRTQDGL